MRISFFALILWTVLSTASPTRICEPSAFSNVTIPSIQISELEASVLMNISATLKVGAVINAYPVNITNLNVCQVSIQYTHPGQNDVINTTVWLPLDGWTGRYMAVGGGGWSAESYATSLMQPASLGFAVSMTDAGHDPYNPVSAPWGMSSDGNVDWKLLLDFARTAYDDMATISKLVILNFYGSRPRYSYWNGCSTGGRQGYQMAQSYPFQFNGILASAPAINWARFAVAEYWPQLTMNTLDVFPRQCELEAVNAAAIQACDMLDGVKDGIINNPYQCKFDPRSVIGQTFTCKESGSTMQISSGAAQVVLALWTGPTTIDGKFEWYGLNPGASTNSLANTTCSADGHCVGHAFYVSSNWMQRFVIRNNSTTLQSLNQSTYNMVFRESVDQYTSIISAENPDLTDFRNAGGKMITWHGLADEVIPPNGTYNYYQRVLQQDPNATDYYRYFPAPGIQHCYGGLGWYPGNAIWSLVDWVEKGVVPDTLGAKTVFDPNMLRSVNLCAYPKQLAYIGGNSSEASSFACQ